MKKQTKTPAADDASVTLARELYDIVMGEIEPELTTKMLPEMEFILSEDTPEDAKRRAKHYTWAFAQFFAIFEDVMKDVFQELQRVKKAIMQHAKKDLAEKESTVLRSIEEKLNNS